MPELAKSTIGKDERFLQAIKAAESAARLDVPVLVYGETGSGKGVVAEIVHRASGRTGPFVSINCATLQPNLFESELFGYMKGAFTGADKDTPGLFEAAEGGTLFLDEIGDAPLEVQPKLLRALEEGVVRRVGGRTETAVNVRLVCATNKQLTGQIEAGKFREDLYYRINAYVIQIPPLRERVADISELAAHFLAEAANKAGAPKRISDTALRMLKAYDWPGNVRELRSAIQYGSAKADGATELAPEHLPDTLQSAGAGGQPGPRADHRQAFRELYLRGGEDPRLWAEFLLALNEHLGTPRFSRGDMLECLRDARGPEPTDNALVNEWQRHIKPVPLRLGLIAEEGKKLRVNLDACAALAGSDVGIAADAEIETEQAPDPGPIAPSRSVTRRTNLPGARTSFVGRDTELAELKGLLADEGANLITLTGPGGTGKTRLAREVARRTADDFPGGAWFADLTESRNIEGVAYAVAQALGVPLTAKQAPERVIADVLASRPATLLVLDNFEQVVHTAADTVGVWVREAPQVRFLVTSRAVLGIEAEREVELQPLNLPQTLANEQTIATSDAVRLFVERARVQNVSFALTAKNSKAVADICARLEGMPLAIELAAARTVVMQPEQILERIDKSYSVLKSSRRDVAARQRSLEASIDWSFDLLSEAEKLAFVQLSAFRGGFFLEAAEAVLDLSGVDDTTDAVDVIQSLREKSLLRASETPYETRFSMYQVVRTYAETKRGELISADPERELTLRHARYFAEYADKLRDRVHTEDALEIIDRLDYARNNLRAVLDWAVDSLDDDEIYDIYFRIAAALSFLMKMRGPARPRVATAREVLSHIREGDTERRIKILQHLAQAETESGDPSLTMGLLEEALKLAEESGDARGVAVISYRMASQLFHLRKIDEALEAHEHCMKLLEEVGEVENHARSIGSMALVLTHKGRMDDALAHIDECERLLRADGDPGGIAFAMATRGAIHFHRLEPDRSLAAYEEAESIYARLGDRRMRMMMRANRALLQRMRRNLHEAASVMREVEAMAEEDGDLMTLATNAMNLGLVLLDLGELDEAEKQLRRGAELNLRLGHNNPHVVCHEQGALIHARRGDFAKAREQWQEAIGRLETDDEVIRGSVDITRAEIAVLEGDFEEAIRRCESALAVFEQRDRRRMRDYFRGMGFLARALHGVGRHEEALARAESALLTAQAVDYRPDDPSPAMRDEIAFLNKLVSGK